LCSPLEGTVDIAIIGLGRSDETENSPRDWQIIPIKQSSNEGKAKGSVGPRLGGCVASLAALDESLPPVELGAVSLIET